MLFDIDSFDKRLFTNFYNAGRFIYGVTGRLKWKDIALHTNLKMGVDLYNLDDENVIRMTPELAKKLYMKKFKNTKYDFVNHVDNE
jgi:hypothetical protein